MNKISILVRQKGRAEMFKNMQLSALAMATHPDDIEFVTYIGDDDNEIYEYLGDHKVIKGDPTFNNNAYNACQKAATGNIYMWMANDFTFDTKDWDTFVLREFEKYPDKIVLVCPDVNNWENWGHGVVGFLHKNWVEAVGYFMPPYDGARSHDKWWHEVASSINRAVRLMDMHVTDLNAHDEMHKRKNQQALKEGWTKMYHSPEMVEARKREIQALKNYINA
jgi:hypothetical protein